MLLRNPMTFSILFLCVMYGGPPHLPPASEAISEIKFFTFHLGFFNLITMYHHVNLLSFSVLSTWWVLPLETDFFGFQKFTLGRMMLSIKFLFLSGTSFYYFRGGISWTDLLTFLSFLYHFTTFNFVFFHYLPSYQSFNFCYHILTTKNSSYSPKGLFKLRLFLSHEYNLYFFEDINSIVFLKISSVYCIASVSLWDSLFCFLAFMFEALLRRLMILCCLFIIKNEVLSQPASH